MTVTGSYDLVRKYGMGNPISGIIARREINNMLRYRRKQYFKNTWGSKMTIQELLVRKEYIHISDLLEIALLDAAIRDTEYKEVILA